MMGTKSLETDVTLFAKLKPDGIAWTKILLFAAQDAEIVRELAQKNAMTEIYKKETDAQIYVLLKLDGNAKVIFPACVLLFVETKEF